MHHVRNLSRLSPPIFHTASDKNLGLGKAGYKANITHAILSLNTFSNYMLYLTANTTTTVDELGEEVAQRGNFLLRLLLSSLHSIPTCICHQHPPSPTVNKRETKPMLLPQLYI